MENRPNIGDKKETKAGLQCAACNKAELVNSATYGQADTGELDMLVHRWLPNYSCPNCGNNPSVEFVEKKLREQKVS